MGRRPGSSAAKREAATIKEPSPRIPMIGVIRRGRGGPHNAKISPTRQETLELAKEYGRLKRELKEVFRLYRSVRSLRNWREILRTAYEWLPEDIIQRLADPDHTMYAPSNLAMELAARNSINSYSPFSVTADRLKKLRGQ